MVNSCAKCKLKIPAGESAESVKCIECNDIFHIKCTTFTLNKHNRKTTYKCEKCKGSADNTESEEDTEKHYSILKAIKEMRTDFNATLDKRITYLEEKMSNSLDLKFSNIKHTIDEIGQTLQTSIDSLKSENLALKEKYESLEETNNALKEEVNILREQMHDQQQYSRLMNVEIVGVPTTKGECVYQILEAIAKSIGVSWHRDGISVAHRLPLKGTQRYPNLIVRFISRTTRLEWLMAAKLKDINANNLSASLPPSKIFLNEHLTSYNKALLSQAKKMVREKSLAYAWVKNGAIFIKTTSEGRARRVRSFEDFEGNRQESSSVQPVKNGPRNKN